MLAKQLSIKLAQSDQVRDWSFGEIQKPETINYRTLKPEKDGLFCEKIFGPTKDWECNCGKYKRVRFKGIICERCGVEVTRSKVRRERLGHIELAAPVTHIWYFKGIPSRLSYLVDIAPKQLEKVVYFAANLVISVDEEARHNDKAELEVDIKEEITQISKDRDLGIEEKFKELEETIKAAEERNAKKAELEKYKKATDKEVEELRANYDGEIEQVNRIWDLFNSLTRGQLVDDGPEWRELSDRYEEYFKGGMGAAVVREYINTIDLDVEEVEIKELIANSKAQKKAKAIKRLKVVTALNQKDEDGNYINHPTSMILDVVPVIPPDLRPMVQLDGGRFATSDLNDLYRRVINRNNRLKRLIELGAPEIIISNEKRMLQESVDALFDNGRRGRPVQGQSGRALKSLSDMLKGKQGRFRQNLLGKRVDYSGRSVIVVGPQLKLYQCGLPKQMALELFKPFVMKRLVDLELASNIKFAKRMVERAYAQVWDVLEDVIKEHPVFLNRAPTLHRLGIQAFEPVLVEGKAVQVHPLVCSAFNADFDGDQMAVHVPISPEAQAEARLLMLSSQNILSPASGKPLTLPTNDMIIGVYYLTIDRANGEGEGKFFSSLQEAILAHDDRFQAGGFPSSLTAKVNPGNSEDGKDRLSLHAKIFVKVDGGKFPELLFPAPTDAKSQAAARASEDAIIIKRYEDGNALVKTTLGKLLVNSCFPDTFPFVSIPMKKKELTEVCPHLSVQFDRAAVSESLDKLKSLGFEYSSKAGLTISLADVDTPSEKAELMEKFEGEAEKVETQYEKGIITDEERRQKQVEIWTDATEQVKKALVKTMDANPFNPIEIMIGSGARGNIMQLRQISGMRGLVANPRGDVIPRPIKSNFREGLSVLEYFISTHGARKGLADTALRTADSGYLTRRLVDVSQELIVRDDDCETTRGIWVEDINPDHEDARLLENKLLGRSLLEAITLTDKTKVEANAEVDPGLFKRILNDPKIDRIRVRSVMTCDTKSGVCRECYGTMLATGELVEKGEAIGIIAAQSIGEPGTQLTMRTFHTGGIAGEDITHGLPRVVELFEARTPKGKAILAMADGVVRIGDNEKGDRVVTVISDDGEEFEYPVSRRTTFSVEDGAEVKAGDRLTGDAKTPLDPKQLLEVLGLRATQLYLVEEVQRVYLDQGVSIHDKHVEVVVRQMLRRVTVSDPGDSEFLPGQKVDTRLYTETNRLLVKAGKSASEARPELMGITKASLATDSWLSAASFQDTTRVLTEAAIENRSDSLVGLKENVIIGKLIPAGTGMFEYRNIATDAPGYQSAALWTEDDSELDMADQLRDALSGQYSLSLDADG